jgi:hypothetical protein
MMHQALTNVKTVRDFKLIVTFENGVKKLYDCKELLKRKEFENLKDPIQFNMARAEKFAVVWNEDLDLSEYELWKNGKITNKNK